MCAAGKECQLSLRERETLRRDRGSCHTPECSRGNLDNLQIGDVQRIGLVSDRREIAGMFAGLLLLVLGHLQARDLERPILADREMDSLGQCEAADVGGIYGRRGRESKRNHRGRAKESPCDSLHVPQVLVADLGRPQEQHQQQVNDHHPSDQDESIGNRPSCRPGPASAGSEFQRREIALPPAPWMPAARSRSASAIARR